MSDYRAWSGERFRSGQAEDEDYRRADPSWRGRRNDDRPGDNRPRDTGRFPEPMSERTDFGRFGSNGFRDDRGPRSYGEPQPSGSVYDRGDLRQGRRGYPDYREPDVGYRDADYRNSDHRGSERGFWDRASDEVSSWFGDRDAERRRGHDQRVDHRGRGPRGYTRSDDRIREDVNEQLMENPVVDASDIEVMVSGAEVTLNGTVDSRYTKRVAEETAERVLGVTHVQNNLRVREAPSVATDIADKPYARSGTPPAQME